MTVLGFRGVHPVMLLFFPLALSVLFGGLPLYRRWRARLPRPARAGYPWAFAALAAVSVGLFPLARASGQYMLLYYMSVLAAFAALNTGLALAYLMAGPREPWPHVSSRRRFLAGGAVAAAGAMVGLAGIEASAGDGPSVAERRIDLQRHPEAAPGRPLRLSLVTDLHAGFFLSEAIMGQALDRLEAFRPDAILFGGDLVEHGLESLDQTRFFLEKLAWLAPAYGVLGNHDCHVNPDGVAAFLALKGVRVLRGQSLPLAGEWGRFTLGGLRDVREPEAGSGCLRGLPNASTILLAHNPQWGLMLEPRDVPWLTLSGHTHGGQLRLPGIGAAINQADRRIGPGVNVVEGRRIAVSSGLGYSGLPVWLGCPPDVTNIVVS